MQGWHWDAGQVPAQLLPLIAGWRNQKPTSVGFFVRSMQEKNWSWICLWLALVLAGAAYSAGLNGPFLFDDEPNLKALGDLNSVNDWQSFKAFVFGGGAGPSGRPLSLLSFLIDDNTWPSVAAPFKYTSLCLHLICGLLLAWATYLLLLAAHFSESRAAWLAVLGASLWLLHPFWVSTTLYVVQRMTILCTLFMLAGMVGYLKGRLWLMQPERHAPWAAYALMTASAGLGTVLAVLSKENGALLPLLLLVIEAFLRRMRTDAPPHKAWVALVLGLPALAILGYLARLIDFSPGLWPARPFNQVERLYSEARIVWDYLGQLWLPRIEGAGLFQDGFEISRSLTQPMSTLWAVLGWVAVLLALPWLYKRWPFVWLALAFFLCGHLIESTVVGLELHFEHRNYGPALFMFLPLALGVDWLGRRHRPRMAVAAALALVAMLGAMTWQRSQLWVSADTLQTYWALKDPRSARGRNYLISRLVAEKKYAEALVWADKSLEELPHSSLMTMSWLRIHVNTGQASERHFERATQLLVQQAFDAQTVAGLRTLVDDAVAMPPLARYRRPLLQLLDTLSEQGPYKQFPLFMRVVAYNKARLHLAMGEVPQAHAQYLEAMQRYGRVSSAMQMFAEMAGAGHLDEAQQMLDRVAQGLADGSLSPEPLSVAHYKQELAMQQKTLNAERQEQRRTSVAQ